MIDLDSMPPDDAEFVRRNLKNRGCWEFVGDKAKDLTRDPIFQREISKPSKPRGEPNKLEADFGQNVLCLRDYEAITFYLSQGVSYTPDWVVRAGDTLAIVEVKLETKYMKIKRITSRIATQNRESLTKLKLCADRYRTIDWFLAKRDQIGTWHLYRVTGKGISRKPEEVPWLT